MKRASLKKAKRGFDENAFFAEFGSRYYLLIRNAARRYADDAGMADEVFSDACLKLLLAGESFFALDEGRQVRYIVKTVRNCAYHCLLQKGKEKERSLPWEEQTVEKNFFHESAEDTVLRLKEIEELRAAVQMLPSKERDALLLKFWMDMDYHNIASVIGISEASVHKTISRAIEKLRKALYGKESRL